MKNLKGLEAIKKDIKDLRGSKVEIFGQVQIIEANVDELTIDILDIIENLERYEVREIEVLKHCEECYNSSTKEVEECTSCYGEGFIYEYVEALEALEIMDDSRELIELEADNSYNWDSLINNNFDFRVYKNTINKKIYIEFKVHRYGDVRTNYTDTAVLELNNFDDFIKAISEVNKTITIDNYNCEINVFSGGIEVYDKDGGYVDTLYVCDMEELKKEIAEL